MGADEPQAPPQPPQQGSPWWWVPDLGVALIGLLVVGLGVYDHDNQTLLVLGVSTVTAAAGHVLGKQSPTP